MSMNEMLAQYYNTHGAADAAQEETAKLAHAELFAKLAAKNGIDLSQMSPQQIEELYGQVFPKTAEEEKKEEEKAPPPFPPKKDEEAKDDEEKSAAAMAHWQEKRAFQEKFAEADLMGRVMAHSFHDELNKIAAAKEAATKQAEGEPPPFPPKSDKSEEKDEKKEEEKDKESAAKLAGIPKNANAQAFEELAARRAIEMAKQAGYDEKAVFDRVNAVYILGLDESEKVAQVQDYDTGLHVRALEYLEKIGLEVNWQEVFDKNAA